MLALVFFTLELRGRRLRNLRPGSLKDVWDYSQRRVAPSPRYAALLFALMSLFIFQIWEAFLRFLLQRDASLMSFVLGAMAVVGAIVLRQKRFFDGAEVDKRLGQLTLVLMCVGFSILLNSWGTLLFVPWVYFRASFLPRRLG